MLRLLVIAALAMPTTATAAEQQGDKRERRICKREVAIGSLVAAKRTCLTREEWKKAERYNKQTVEEWQEAIDRNLQPGSN